MSVPHLEDAVQFWQLWFPLGMLGTLYRDFVQDLQHALPATVAQSEAPRVAM